MGVLERELRQLAVDPHQLRVEERRLQDLVTSGALRDVGFERFLIERDRSLGHLGGVFQVLCLGEDAVEDFVHEAPVAPRVQRVRRLLERLPLPARHLRRHHSLRSQRIALPDQTLPVPGLRDELEATELPVAAVADEDGGETEVSVHELAVGVDEVQAARDAAQPPAHRLLVQPVVCSLLREPIVKCLDVLCHYVHLARLRAVGRLCAIYELQDVRVARCAQSLQRVFRRCVVVWRGSRSKLPRKNRDGCPGVLALSVVQLPLEQAALDVLPLIEDVGLERWALTQGT
mmetsp:Transcript_28772/g.68785  ORF Transcript_28772/g.68785 Transcript_28772/m.68785 type:complete len:289 (+) Transcript_28772:1897-2763(+)